MPEISIVTPVFNGRRFIEPCLASVRHALAGQDYEHIVVDGLSTDGTLEFLQDQKDIRLVSGKDRGMYDALNKGVDAAAGTFIGHLNSDEQYNRAGLLQALESLRTSGKDAVFGPTVMLNGRFEFLQLFKQVVTPRPIDAQWHMPVQTASFLYRRSVWEQERYRDDLKAVADHAWFRSRLERGLTLEPVTEPIGIFLWHGANISCGPDVDALVLSDVDRKSGTIRRAKLTYRFKKWLAGGYSRSPVTYEYFDGTRFQSVTIERPVLKIGNFDKTALDS